MNEAGPLFWSPLQGPPAPLTLAPPAVQPTPTRLKCTVPSCGKLFTRKEHLTRHLKSHDPQRQYACHICGRRYARSDVLKRHVEHHVQDSGSARTLVPCDSCHERKLKCDYNVPCRSCTRSSLQCSHSNPRQRDRVSVGTDMDTVNDVGYENTQVLPNGMGESDEMHPGLLIDNHQQPLPNTGQEPGSMPFPAVAPNIPFTSSSGMMDTSGIVEWAGLTNQRRHAEGASSDATTRYIPFAVPTSARMQDLPSAPSSDVNQGDGAASSVPSQSPASSEYSQDDPSPDLDRYLSKESLDTARLVQLYFEDFHPYWPIIHAPTFDTEDASHVLLGSMIMLASWLDGSPNHMKLAPHVFDAVNLKLLEPNPSFGKDIRPMSLQTLQALQLCAVYAVCCRAAEPMLARAVHFNSVLISTCRHLGIFSGQLAHHDFGDRPNAYWLDEEKIKRLAFSVLRIDAYLSVLVDQPPSVRYQEICIPLPVSPQVWAAASDEERRRLRWSEPAGREKALLCFLMRDALDFNRRRHLPCQLTEADYHLGLCSLQVGIWEAARDVHSCERDELVPDPSSWDPSQLWRTHLHLWRLSTEEDCKLRQNYFSTPPSTTDHLLTALSLTMWHISALTLLAPFQLLQGQGCCYNCRAGTAVTKQKNKSRLRAWVASPQARNSVWNAAQISRIVARESATPMPTTCLLLNPLATSGVLKSAIVTCTYAYHTRACPVCTGGPPVDLVDLFAERDEEEKLVKWKEQGGGLATWSASGISVCSCKIGALVAWFRKALAMDKVAEKELMSFLGGLRDR